jgi:CBS domain-containing protein
MARSQGKEQVMKAIYISARETANRTRLARKPIVDVMTKPPILVSERELLDDALVRMISSGVRHLVVVDETGRCVGVLSDRAITAVWATEFDALAVRNVASALEPESATVCVLDEVIDAAMLMREQGIDAVAVTDTEGRPVGIVTGGDLVALLAV